MSKPSKVFRFDNDDPDMQRAYQTARKTFRYFWRELAWERRRIIPGLDLACVKAPFSDSGERGDGNPDVEHMWINDVDFDGESVSGVLMNAPNWVRSVEEGDSARFLRNDISDWMYAINGEVFGAFTVQVLRSRMGRRERQQHDKAWGTDFGDPDNVRLVPTWDRKNSSGMAALDAEHPMSENMAPGLREQLEENPSMVHSADDEGWTLLHQQALAGSYATVKVLLEFGADRAAVTKGGFTPLHLAKSLGWDRVIQLLTDRKPSG